MGLGCACACLTYEYLRLLGRLYDRYLLRWCASRVDTIYLSSSPSSLYSLAVYHGIFTPHLWACFMYDILIVRLLLSSILDVPVLGFRLTSLLFPVLRPLPLRDATFLSTYSTEALLYFLSLRSVPASCIWCFTSDAYRTSIISIHFGTGVQYVVGCMRRYVLFDRSPCFTLNVDRAQF